MFDIFNALGKMKDIQKRLAEVKAGLNDISLDINNENNTINVTITASKSIKYIKIDEDYLKNTPKKDIETGIAAIINKAIKSADDKSKAVIHEEMKDHIPDIPGLDLSKFGLG